MPSPSPATSRLTVLDPSADSREVLAELLARTGAEVTAVETTVEALQIVETSRAEALLFDVDSLPEAETALITSAAAATGVLTVVVGTNRPEGGDLFVRKPYHYRELIHKILAAFGAHRDQPTHQTRAAA